MTEPSTTGGCLCGGVRFELTRPAEAAGYCHCTRCQKRTGSASSAQARIDGAHVPAAPGRGAGEGVAASRRRLREVLLLASAASHLFSRSEDRSQMSIRMAAFDGDPGVRPSWRAFVAYAAPWEPIPDDGLERYEESRPR